MFCSNKKLKEAKRPGKETSAKNNERQAIGNLIISTVRKSNERSTELLKSSDIVSMILQILDSKHYIHYQDMYLGILVTYILPKCSNHSNIIAEQWRELLIVCVKLYKRAHLKKYIVLDALQMIVKYSFSYVNLLADVKNLLLFLGIVNLCRATRCCAKCLYYYAKVLKDIVINVIRLSNILEKVFEDVKTNDEQLTESFYKLSNSVCRQVATESRITLCKFSETILMDMLSLNGSEEKYKLLLIFLQIHHPEGISKCDDGAYAHDWDKWKDLMRRMCLLIQENCKLDVQWRSFVQFASEGRKI